MWYILRVRVPSQAKEYEMRFKATELLWRWIRHRYLIRSTGKTIFKKETLYVDVRLSYCVPYTSSRHFSIHLEIH